MDPKNHLSYEEVKAAICNLSSADSTRLFMFALNLVGRRYDEADDLIQECFLRALRGTRKCPRNVEFRSFCYGVMKSVRSTETEQRRERGIGIEITDAETEDQLKNFQTPERYLSSQEMERAIFNEFKDDQIANIILEGWMDGITGEALRSKTGLDKTPFASKCRAVRRRLTALFAVKEK
jgi:hypothetical protein